MGILDQMTRTANQFVSRAKFEAEKFQRTSRLQGELSDLQKQLDAQLIELGQRAYELHRAGQISATTVATMTQAIDGLRVQVTQKEEELSAMQAEEYIEPPQLAESAARTIPVIDETPAQAAPALPMPPPVQATPATKTCTSCGFLMPQRSLFCPNCGTQASS